MSLDQIHASLDTIDATPRDGFLDELEEQLIASWNVDNSLDAEVITLEAGDLVSRQRRLRRAWLLTAAAAALVVLAVGLGAFVATRGPDRAPSDTIPPGPTTPTTPAPTTPAPTTPATTTPTTTAPFLVPTTLAAPERMWPQTSVDAARQAQEFADGGDPAYTWQIDSALVSLDWYEHLRTAGSEVVTRFLRDELGWEQFLFAPDPNWDLDSIEGDNEGSIDGVVYLRCAPGTTNPLYPDPETAGPLGGHQCAPTIDDTTYETVSLDLRQPASTGAEGIWVVSDWREATPFVQVDPQVVEDAAVARLEDFLQARVDGNGAEGRVEVNGLSDLVEVPLLYATSTGDPYERYEIERVSGPWWPHGDNLSFTVRMFANADGTVVEQQIGSDGNALSLDERGTTENGQPVPIPYTFVDGAVTLLAPSPWKHAFEQNASLVLGDGDYVGRNLELIADPLPVTTGCVRGQAPADAAALAASLRSDPDLVTTTPLPITVAGADGLMLDVTPAPDAGTCRVLTPGPDAGYDLLRAGGTLPPGSRMRLYLIDHPAGSPATQLLAIAIVAPEAEFDAVLEAAMPILDSIELRP